MASLISTAQAAALAVLDGAAGAQRINDLNQRSMTSMFKVKLGTLLKTIRDLVADIDAKHEVCTGEATFDFAVLGGVKDVAIPIGSALPVGAVLIRSYIESTTAVLSAGAATIKVGFAGGGNSEKVLAVVNGGKAVFAALVSVTTAQEAGAAAHVPAAVTAGSKLLVEIGTANITAGKFTVHYEYVI